MPLMLPSTSFWVFSPAFIKGSLCWHFIFWCLVKLQVDGTGVTNIGSLGMTIATSSASLSLHAFGHFPRKTWGGLEGDLIAGLPTNKAWLLDHIPFCADQLVQLAWVVTTHLLFGTPQAASLSWYLSNFSLSYLILHQRRHSWAHGLVIYSNNSSPHWWFLMPSLH